MWPAFVIALFAGFLVGYLFRKVFIRDGAADVPRLEAEIESLQHEVEQAKSTQKLLEQEVADLTYKLGEEQKARAYAEQRSGSASE